ncbi:MAG TPA: hypothetical protein PKU89_06730, partial [Kiritimatiellia bacterium]|nr:hypothetical protein [Kiritimatiellia bacterium]
MTKVFKIAGSPFYYYRVHVGGKDKWKSTRTENKKQAQKIADGHRAATVGTLNADELFHLLLAKLDGMPEDERQSKRLDYGQRLIRLQSSTLPFGDAWSRWLTMPNKSRFGNPKPNTLAGYSAIWKRLEKWAAEKSIVNLHEM